MPSLLFRCLYLLCCCINDKFIIVKLYFVNCAWLMALHAKQRTSIGKNFESEPSQNIKDTHVKFNSNYFFIVLRQLWITTMSIKFFDVIWLLFLPDPLNYEGAFWGIAVYGGILSWLPKFVDKVEFFPNDCSK